MESPSFTIQELVAESGVPRRTIHFYVQQGILPPPSGAGLAAVYGEEHRLRLALIPILRRQGLRLDQIRQRFSNLALDEMRRIAAEAEAAPATAGALPYAAAPAPASLRLREGDVIPAHTAPQGGQRFVHYAFPAGIMLVVPENLPTLEQRRVELLLQAAQHIFAPVYPVYPKDDSANTV